VNTKTQITFIKLLPFYIFFTGLVFLTSGNIFFWDTVQLASRHAHFFYENNFSDLLLPDTIDSGHIPAFGMYIALIWKLFGKTLFISHIAMLPFIYGIIFQAYRFIKNFISEPYVFWALALFLADATLLAQSTLVSPDIALIFFFLTALNSILKNRKIILTIAVLGLFLTGMRGTMLAFSILIIDITQNITIKNKLAVFKELLHRVLIYLPGFAVFLFYSLYHFKVKHWIAYHEESPWAQNFELTDFNGFFKNFGIFIWRLIDFGRVFLWITGIILLFKFRNLFKTSYRLKQLLIVFVTTLIVLSISFLSYKSLTAHRYILSVYLIFSVIVSYIIFEKLHSKKLKIILFSLILTGMLSGNFWIYPKHIAQGWDSSLAYLPYFKLRKQAIQYMNDNKIPVSETGSAFPNSTEFKYLDLSNSKIKFPEKNLQFQDYIFYSNIYNDFSDNELHQLSKNFSILKEYKSRGISIILYKKRPD
jgi:hypothetical protein